MPYIYNGKQITQGKRFQDTNGKWHTDKWADWSQEQMGAVGITWEEPPAPVQTPEHHEFTEKVNKNDMTVVAMPIETAKERMLAKAHQLSKNLRDGGLMVNGILLSTDMEARSLMNGGRNDRKATRKIVSKKGRANVTGAQFISMVDAVEDFIQEVFDREYDLQEAIDLAVTKEDLEARHLCHLA